MLRNLMIAASVACAAAALMTAKMWEAEVTKMIATFGAPIDPPDAKTIIDYLARNYGSP